MGAAVGPGESLTAEASPVARLDEAAARRADVVGGKAAALALARQDGLTDHSQESPAS